MQIISLSLSRGKKSRSRLMNAELCSRSYQMKAWTGKNSGPSAHKFLFSYLIMWISVRKSASPTLQPSQDPEQDINKKCATSPGRVCTSAWRARCRSDARTCLRCSHTRSPAIMAGWVVTSYSLFCSRTWRPETKTVGTHVELEMMGGGAAEVMG